ARGRVRRTRAGARLRGTRRGRGGRPAGADRGDALVSQTGALRLVTVQGDGIQFEARFDTGTLVMDSGKGVVHPSPVEALLAAVAACQAMDVIVVMRKKRQQVTAYEVRMSGERVAESPRRFTAITLVHRLTGRGLERAAAEDAVRIAHKHC